MLFLNYVYESNIHYITLTGLVIGILHLLCPMQYLNEKLFFIPNPPPNTLSYKEAIYFFDTEYSTENPATCRLAK